MKLNEQNYNESIKNGACVVTFSAPWCKDCVALKPILSRLMPEYEGKISFFEVDFDSGIITDKTTGKSYKGQPFPEFMQKIITAGGLVNYINEK